ncbi:MAG: non-ribosomal peptide synthetase [Sulfitobacter sp.]
MTNSYDLTPQQQNMYASAALTGQPWQYVEQIVVRLKSEVLDADAMGQAWSELAAAHPALRNVIVAASTGAPVQQVRPPAQIFPKLFDWRHYDQAQIDQELRQFLDEDRTAGVDATVTPAFRVAIFHTGSAQSILVWTFPHSLLDGRSFAPLLDEVFQRYNRIGSGAGADDSLGPEQSVFETHCRALTAMSHDEGIDYFAAALAGWEGAEGLVQPEAEPTRKVEFNEYLSADETQAIAALAKKSGVTASTVVLATWGVVLARFSGQSDVVFGNTRNGRHVVKGARDAAGCFITTVPVRVQLNPALTLGDVLQHIRNDQIAVRPFEHAPLTDIRRRLDVPPGRQIFDSVVMFDFGTLETQLKALGGDWQDRDIDLLEEGDTPVSVAAYMGPQLKIVVEYDPAQVPQGARLGGYLCQFIKALTTATPDTPLGALSMLEPEDHQRIIDLAGPETAPDAKALTCIDRFEQTAAQQPDHTALMQPNNAQMSYAALNTAADKMAAHLTASRAGPGDIIGICMARGMPFITAMLAVWKVGAAFVPMDPSYPIETLNIIAQDSGARLVLSDATTPTLDAPMLDIDSLDDPAASAVSTSDGQGRGADDLAYVIFTSGSTGRPKGVMVTHASLAAHADAIVPHFGLTPDDRVLQFAALSFDVALEEVIPTLVSGATLVLRSDEMAQSVPVFLEQLDALGITITNLPTGFWVALTEVLDGNDLAFPTGVRLVIVGGERVPLSTLKRWHKCLPDLRWLNGYGPTETTITCTTHEVTPADLNGESVPIGRPLGHARAWVLSADGALAPEGAEGELFISGPAVAKGYINDPDRTAQSFSTAVFDADIGRVYATGDRVIWRRGLLHYLGRMDRQIKLRGFRIEPGQIEAALESHDAIKRVYADVLTQGSGQPQLVAWYSAVDGTDLPSSEVVKDWAAETLPPQMRPIPVAVTEWPQTPGGKIDLARLPRPSAAKDAGKDMEAADAPLVREIANLFADILQIDDVGAATSFFDAGGDSLSLLRLMPELERTFDVQLKPTAIYGDPTPQGVARALKEKNPNPLVIIPIQPEGQLPPLYGVHVLGDNGSFFRPLSKVLGNEQPVLGLTVGLLTESTPTTVPDIARFYLRQIERKQPTGPLSLIAVSAGSYAALELAQQLLAAGRDVQALILLDAEGPAGRMRVGPVARVAVHMQHLLQQGWPYIRTHLAARKEARIQNAAQARLQSAGDTDNAIQAQNISGVEDFIAANQIAIDAYDPQPYARKLTIFRAAADRFDSAQAIENGLGWAPIAAAGFDVIDVPGDHLGILQPPNVQTLGTQIKTLLASRRKTKT